MLGHSIVSCWLLGSSTSLCPRGFQRRADNRTAYRTAYRPSYLPRTTVPPNTHHHADHRPRRRTVQGAVATVTDPDPDKMITLATPVLPPSTQLPGPPVGVSMGVAGMGRPGTPGTCSVCVVRGVPSEQQAREKGKFRFLGPKGTVPPARNWVTHCDAAAGIPRN